MRDNYLTQSSKCLEGKGPMNWGKTGPRRPTKTYEVLDSLHWPQHTWKPSRISIKLQKNVTDIDLCHRRRYPLPTPQLRAIPKYRTSSIQVDWQPREVLTVTTCPNWSRQVIHKLMARSGSRAVNVQGVDWGCPTTQQSDRYCFKVARQATDGC